MHFHTVPGWIKRFFSNFIWHIDTNEKAIFLTFDDGPIPEITEFVIDELAKFNAKATFFCVGENITKHPSIFEKIVSSGHAFGNHTYNHLKGWQTPNDVYFTNIYKTEETMRLSKSGSFSIENSKLFRPPYGRIKSSQAKALRESYKIIMWDVLTCDYDKNLDGDVCLRNAIKNTGPGSIVVFHDSVKAEKNLRFVLPRYLAHFSEAGYEFRKIKASP